MGPHLDRTPAFHLNLDLLSDSLRSHLLVSLPNVATWGLLRVVAKWLSVAARAQALTLAQITRPANLLGENSSWNKFTVGKSLPSHRHPLPSLSPNVYACTRYSWRIGFRTSSETSGMLKGVSWNVQGPQNTGILPCPQSHFSLTYPRKHKASEYTKQHCSGDKSKGGMFVYTKDKCDFSEYFL